MSKTYDPVIVPVEVPYLRIIPEVVDGDVMHQELVIANNSIKARSNGLEGVRFLNGELHLKSGLQYLASVPYFKEKKLEGLLIPNDDLFDLYRKVQTDLMRRKDAKLSYVIVHELIRVAMKGGRSLKIMRID